MTDPEPEGALFKKERHNVPFSDNISKQSITNQKLTKTEIVTNYLDEISFLDTTMEPSACHPATTRRGSSNASREPLCTNMKRPESHTDHPNRNISYGFDQVSVCLRIKPPHARKNPVGKLSHQCMQYEIDQPKESKIADRNRVLRTYFGFKTREYRFERIFDPSKTNADVNASLWPQISSKLINHQDVSIMCYGATGTGKSFTMNGIMRFVIREIFQMYAKETSIIFKISALEIYCDRVTSLLRTAPLSGQPFSKSSIMKKKIPTLNVTSFEEALEGIETAQRQRKQESHSLNRSSSRSHTLVFLYIIKGEKKQKICFIDLAGSERVKRTGSVGQAFQEGISINRSLSSLFGLFSSLQRSKKLTSASSHCPNRSYLFRGNLLTQYLYSISNSFFILMANISSDASSFHETKASLDFATLSRKVGIDRLSTHCFYSSRNNQVPDFQSESHKKISSFLSKQTIEMFTNFDRKMAPQEQKIEKTIKSTLQSHHHVAKAAWWPKTYSAETQKTSIIQIINIVPRGDFAKSIPEVEDFVRICLFQYTPSESLNDMLPNLRKSKLRTTCSNLPVPVTQSSVIDPFHISDSHSHILFYPVSNNQSKLESSKGSFSEPLVRLWKGYPSDSSFIDAFLITLMALLLGYHCLNSCVM